MIHHLVLPDLGEGVAEGEVIAWLVEPGQAIAADEPIVEVSTDKADVVIPSAITGTVVSLRVDVGQAVSVGTALAQIDDGQDGESETTPPTTLLETPKALPFVPADRGPVALPAVRGLARKLGVELSTVRPSGPNGRVTEDDVRAAAAETGNGLRETIARRLTTAAAIPTVTNVDAADFEAVRSARQSPLVACSRAVVLALADHPRLNAWQLDDGSVVENPEVHLGIATQTPKGLLVPVVRNAHLLAAEELGAAIAEKAATAREGRAAPEELRGSTITITSAGMRGGLFATPLLNLPEIAIVGLYRIEQRPAVRDGKVVPRHTGNISVTFDHRAIDGVHAADFLGRVIEILERWPSERSDAQDASQRLA